MEAKFSAMWIVILFNVIFKDLHDFFKPGLIEGMMAGQIDGNIITEPFLLVAAIAIEIPILMVLLSRVLPQKTNRLSQLIIAPIIFLSMFAGSISELDDWFFFMVEAIILGFIFWQAWRWKPSLNTAPA